MEGPRCYSNGTTNAVRLYLRNLDLKFLDLTEEETVEEIKKIVEIDPKSKWLCHNILFLHLDLQELEFIKKDVKYFALINLDWNPISRNVYLDLVFRCHLHKDFLQMIFVTRRREFSYQLLSLAVKKTMSVDVGKLQLTKEEWTLYVSLLPRFCSPKEEFHAEYKQLWSDLVTYFLSLPSHLMAMMNKVEILIRVAGTHSSKPEDYEGTSEISDAIRELDFDPVVQTYDSPSSDFFAEMFSVPKEDMRDSPASQQIFSKLEFFISNLTFHEADDDAQIFLGTKTRISKKTSRVLHYIGDCSYLTNLLLTKNIIQSSNVPSATIDSVKKIQLVTNLLESFKSKSRYEDYKERTMTFHHFCTLLKTNMKYRHSQNSWYDKFFSYEDALTTPEGLELAEEIITPNVSMELGIKILKKILRMPLPLSCLVKKIALILIFNQHLYPNFQAVVDVVFKIGLHDRLCLPGFQEELNDLSNRLGSEGTFCLKTLQLSPTAVQECRQLTLQNPLASTEKLLLRVLQIPECGLSVLKSLDPFWKFLTPLEACKDLNTTLGALSVLESSLIQVILHVIDPLNRNLHLKFMKFVSIILEHRRITKEKFQDIIVDLITTNVETFSIDKLVCLLEIYKELIGNVISMGKGIAPFIQNAYNRVVGFREATYYSSVECHPLRDKAIEIYKLLLEYDQSLLKSITCSPSDFREKDLSLVQLVLLFGRSPSYRETIKCFVNSQNFVIPESISMNELDEIVESSSHQEWSDILDIIYYIMCVKDGVDARLKFLNLVIQVPMFESNVLDTNVPLVEEERTSKKRKKDSELKGPPLIFQLFGSHLVDVLTDSNDPFGFHKLPDVQLEFVRVLVAVSSLFPDEPQYFTAKQLALMSLLNLVTWLVGTQHIGEGFRHNCLVITKALSKTEHGRLEPICQSVIKVLNPEKPGIIPL